jgi:hypothetical protein
MTSTLFHIAAETESSEVEYLTVTNILHVLEATLLFL